MVSELENIKELEQELMRVRLRIIEDEKEYKALEKKVNNLYIGFPIGLAYFIWGLCFATSLQKGGGENLWSIFGIIFVVSIIWSCLMAFGTNAGRRVRKLAKDIEFNKKKKKKNS